MKKILLILTLFFIFTLNINASSVNVSLSCKDRVKSSSSVNCDVYVTPDGIKINGIQINYSFTNATFKTFTVNTALFTKQNSNVSKGIVLVSDSPISSKVKAGTITFVAPASGSATIKLSNIQSNIAGSSSSVSTTPISKTFTIMGKDSTLKNLSLSNAILAPSFSPSVKSYTAIVNASSTIISAVKSDNYASISGIGTKTVNYGTNTYNIVVKSEDGSSTTTYKIVITRVDNREKINTLNQINLSNGVLSPSFNPNTKNYNVNVDSNISKIIITPKKDGEKSTFVKGYSGGNYSLKYGINKIEIKVKSESGSVNTYTINVNRKDNRNNNNYLKLLEVSNTTFTFDKNQLYYDVIVKNKFDKVIITATPEVKTSKVTGLGEIKLKEGINEVKVNVIAENESVRTYTLKIKRLTHEEELSSNTFLKDIKIDNHDIKFNKDRISYIIDIENETSLNINTVTEDETSIVDISGNENLKEGSVITLKVTSTDGSTRDYVLNIIKSTDENLPEKMLVLGYLFGMVTSFIIVVIYLKIPKK